MAICQNIILRTTGSVARMIILVLGMENQSVLQTQLRQNLGHTEMCIF